LLARDRAGSTGAWSWYCRRSFRRCGVGGIDSGAAAFSKIKAGASLIQLYTGLVFRGLNLVTEIKVDLVNFLRLGRYDAITDAVGLDTAAVTSEPWPT